MMDKANNLGFLPRVSSEQFISPRSARNDSEWGKMEPESPLFSSTDYRELHQQCQRQMSLVLL